MHFGESSEFATNADRVLALVERGMLFVNNYPSKLRESRLLLDVGTDNECL